MKIGELRRSLFVGHNCKWNALVRDVTANHEMTYEEVPENDVYVDLIENIKERACLDVQFPLENSSRMIKLFEESV